MAEQNDCACPDTSPTPKRGDGGKKLPDSNGLATQQIQVMGEQSKNPDGTSVVRGFKVGPNGELLIGEFPRGFTGTETATGHVYVNGRLISNPNLT